MSQKMCVLLNAIQEYRQDNGRWPTIRDLVETFDCSAEVAIRAVKRAKYQMYEIGAPKEFHYQ